MISKKQSRSHMRKKNIYKKILSLLQKKNSTERKIPSYIYIKDTTEIYNPRQEDKNWINPILLQPVVLLLHVEIVLGFSSSKTRHTTRPSRSIEIFVRNYSPILDFENWISWKNYNRSMPPVGPPIISSPSKRISRWRRKSWRDFDQISIYDTITGGEEGMEMGVVCFIVLIAEIQVVGILGREIYMRNLAIGGEGRGGC